MSECIQTVVAFVAPEIKKVVVYAEQPIKSVIIPQGSPGPSGPPIVNQNSYLAPYDLADEDEVEPLPRNIVRIFVRGDGAPVTFTLADGLRTRVVYLFGTDNTDTAELVGDNVQLSGPIVLRQFSQIELHWIDGLNKWVEAGRNEI